MEAILSELVERLRKALGERLLSAVLYGSGAGDDREEKFSDLNVLCVLDRVTPAELAAAAPILKWWRDRGNPSPLLMSERELLSSTDSFPIEFQDMLERRRILAGRDLIEALPVSRIFYRAQVEHDLRSRLLRLRQAAAAVLSDPKSLLRLMADSVSTFLVLARHAMALGGVSVEGKKRSVARKLEAIGVDSAPFDALLDLREQAAGAGQFDPVALFGDYLKQIEVLVAFVDRLEE